jgi:hypothetical protein
MALELLKWALKEEAKKLLIKTGIKKVPPPPKEIIDEDIKEKAIGYLHDPEFNVEIQFMKQDDTERVMLCTLSEELIPKDKLPKNEKVTFSKTDSLIKVFDLDKNEWRSFHWNSVYAVNVKNAKIYSDNRFENSTTVEGI